jgi:hypothetical protein
MRKTKALERKTITGGKTKDTTGKGTREEEDNTGERRRNTQQRNTQQRRK